MEKRRKRQKEEIKAPHPVVVVKFHDYVEIPYQDYAEKYVEKSRIGPWSQLLKEFPGISLRRMFTSVSADNIEKLVGRAASLDKEYRPPNLLSYFYIDAPPETNLEELVKILSSWKIVKSAYIDRPAPDPSVNASNDPRSPNQGYLDSSPDGIDAEYAWLFTGGDGAGQRIIDMEQGWTLNHEDLVGKGATLLHGTLRDSSRYHGTAVLGEICAVDNTMGNIGIVPNIASVDVVSYYGSTRANAILAAITNLSFGDVLLLEAQVWLSSTSNMLGPIEIYDAEFDVIRLATALGIVVVEAGGNGTNNGSPPPLNLDTYTNSAGLQILNRDPANPDFRDSGAIIVTAATSTSPHTRLNYAPHGRRIDCYAWGQNIDTCDSDSGGATNMYTSSFSGTSGASPIIAGAALAVQGVAEASLGYRFSPLQLRAILSDPTFGTPPSNTETTHIGVMPNLRAIIDNMLSLALDIYLRDFAGDTGDPHTGPISNSPDIILKTAPVANPQTALGEGSGTENNELLSNTVESTHDNYIYVRVRNRGGLPATNVTAQIFWSEVGTLITPDQWTLVGSVTIPNVPAGNVLTVSDAITWPQAAIPAAGHYCFVGLVGNALDPAPLRNDFRNWTNFERFIRENNNVTWRNFNVAPNTPNPEAGDPKDYVALRFVAPGALDEAMHMRLEVGGKLPQGARLLLEVPQYLMDAMKERSPYTKIDEKSHVAWLPANPHGRKAFAEALFPAKSKAKLKLLVHIPKEFRKNEYEVFVRQIHRNLEVGRVTWRLVPDNRLKAKLPKK